ncbi:MAG: BadF/BadG/BcrA/BcrD ATPase family protein [Rubrivivax sp.]
MPALSSPRSADRLGLGIDAGGTRTRWALALPTGDLVAEGCVAGLSATLLATRAGQQALRDTFETLAAGVLAVGRPAQVHAGLSGYGGVAEPLAALIRAPLALPAGAVSLATDVEVAYLDLFAPGAGYLVYAGTGSIAAFIDEQGQFHRVGGRGGLIDDGGSGFWIAREALRHVWRLEDEQPGAWRHSALAREVLDHVGGADWSHTRLFISSADRGEMGRLALAVAAAASTDAVALRILEGAGQELGRLARILMQRFGARPLALAGRVFALHPVIEQACRAALPGPGTLHVRESRGHHAAARIAARAAAGALAA